MSNFNGMAFLDVGYTNVNDDLKSCIVYDDYGNQNIFKTIDKYTELLAKAITVLAILKDGLSKDESTKISLFSEGDDLGIHGSQDLIDRFVGFGIANSSDDWSNKFDNSDDSESSESFDECESSDSTESYDSS